MESGKRLRVLGNIVGKEFQGDEAIEFEVLGFVNHTHATSAEFLDDAIVGNMTAEDGCGIGHFGCILARFPIPVENRAYH